MDKIKILLDTDLGSDCDDAGALAVLHNLADMGMTEILAVTHCASAISGAVTVKAINEWYGRADIPIGRYDQSVFLEDKLYVRYTEPLMEKYLQTHKMPEFENAVRVQRKILAENQDVTLVAIGMLNNIAELLKSRSDDISPLCGVDLVKNSVKNMYVMGGNFVDLTYAEWNIKLDTKNAQYVAENFPVPIIYCGFELGADIITGNNLEDAHKDSPIRFAYYMAGDGCSQKEKPIRNSWDPITVYCAVNQESSLYTKSENCHITFDDEGRVMLSDGGKDCYLITNASNEEVQTVIDELLC